MFEGVGDLITTLFEGLNIRRRWLAIISFGVIIIFSLLSFEQMTGTIYYNNLQRKIELLKELNTLKSEGDISSNPELKTIYDSTVEELNLRPVRPFTFPTTVITSSIPLWKTISGAAVGLLFIIFFAFQKDQNSSSIIGAIMIAVLGGVVGLFLPIIYSPWVNYLGLPFIQLLLLYLAGGRSKTA